MNLSPFQDTPFGDEDAFEAFQLAHGLAHAKIAQTMFNTSKFYNVYPLFDTPDYDRDWKLFHYTEHQSIFNLLDMSDLPDLATVDFNKQDEYEDWMLQHTLVHARINIALGIA